MGNNKLLVKKSFDKSLSPCYYNCSQCEEDKQIAIRQKRRDSFGFPSVSLP